MAHQLESETRSGSPAGHTAPSRLTQVELHRNIAFQEGINSSNLSEGTFWGNLFKRVALYGESWRSPMRRKEAYLERYGKTEDQVETNREINEMEFAEMVRDSLADLSLREVENGKIDGNVRSILEGPDGNINTTYALSAERNFPPNQGLIIREYTKHQSGYGVDGYYIEVVPTIYEDGVMKIGQSCIGFGFNSLLYNSADPDFFNKASTQQEFLNMREPGFADVRQLVVLPRAAAKNVSTRFTDKIYAAPQFGREIKKINKQRADSSGAHATEW